MCNKYDLFERWGETLARRYGGTFSKSILQQARDNLVSAYENFVDSGCADDHFAGEICSSNLNKSAQRLGEVLLYERLVHAGLSPTSNSVGPDFNVKINGRPIWLELVTPTVGDDIQIPELFLSHQSLFPCPDQSTELAQRNLLRVSSAIFSKIAKYEGYIFKAVVPSNEPLIIVVNDALLCPDTYFYGVSHSADSGVGGLSLVEHAVNGIGNSVWVQGGAGQFVRQSTYRDVVSNRPEPKKDGGVRGAVPVSLFKNPTEVAAAKAAERATILSAALQVTLREDYGVLMFLRSAAEAERPLLEGLINGGTLVNNPRARNPIDPVTGKLLTKVVGRP